MIRSAANSLFIRQRKGFRSSDSVVGNPSGDVNVESKSVTESCVDIGSSGSTSSGGDVEIVVVPERIKENRDAPPTDDVCPICFEEFTLPFKTNCGHWFCGSCFLRFWSYKSSLQKCKCPICSQLISKMTPAAFLLSRQEKDVTAILKNVYKYNRLFQGGVYGLLQKVYLVPLLAKRLVQVLMDPDRFMDNYHTARFIGLILGLLYTISPFDFIPTDRREAYNLFELFAMVLVIFFSTVGLCRRAILIRRMRRLAAAHT